MNYGVVITKGGVVSHVETAFTDVCEGVRWLRAFIIDKLNLNMYLNIGKTHTKIEWNSPESGSDDDLFERAVLDFGDGVFEARILPMLEVPEILDELASDDMLKRGYIKYIAMSLMRGDRGNMNKTAGIYCKGLELLVRGFQNTDISEGLGYADRLDARKRARQLDPAMIVQDENGNAYIVILNQLTRSQVEFLAREFFNFK